MSTDRRVNPVYAAARRAADAEPGVEVLVAADVAASTADRFRTGAVAAFPDPGRYRFRSRRIRPGRVEVWARKVAA